MDFLNQAFAQLKELFRSMSPGARITSTLLLAVVVASVVYMFGWKTSGPDEYLLGGRDFAAGDIAAMEKAFGKASLSTYRVEGNRVKIPRAQKSAYMVALADGNALPADFYKYFDEANAGERMFESNKNRLQRLKNAKEKELALIIRSMRGIEHAAVQYDTVDRGGFPKKIETTAMVAVRPAPSEQLDDMRIRSIKNLVARAIGGLRPDGISVTDLSTGRTWSSGDIDGIVTAEDDPYASRKRMYEEMFADKIGKQLSFIPGVLVNANVELNEELQSQQNSVKFDTKPVPFQSSETVKSNNSTRPVPSGRPGVASNANGSASVGLASSGAGGSANAQSTSEEARNDQKSKVSQDNLSVIKAGLVPNRVTITVSVPSSYYDKVWRDRNPAADGAEAKAPDTAQLKRIEEDLKKDIESLAVTLLPSLPPGKDAYPQVKVTSFQHIVGPPTPEPKITDAALTWLGQNWTTIGMMGVGMFGLLMLRSIIKSVPSPTTPATSAPSDTTGGATSTAVAGTNLSLVSEPDESGDGADGKPKRRFHSGPNLRDELADMVREDPDAAANILRNWIGNVG